MPPLTDNRDLIVVAWCFVAALVGTIIFGILAQGVADANITEALTNAVFVLVGAVAGVARRGGPTAP